MDFGAVGMGCCFFWRRSQEAGEPDEYFGWEMQVTASSGLI